jgi:hypothetical protein
MHPSSLHVEAPWPCIHPFSLFPQGEYQVKPPLPFVPGSEVSGLVTEVGEGVKQFKVGDKVRATIKHSIHPIQLLRREAYTRHWRYELQADE